MKNKKQSSIIAIFGILFFLIITGILTVIMVNTIMNKIIHSRKEIITPNIEGLTLSRALNVLAKKNLSLVKIAEKFDSDVPAGSIISQSPPPGITVREGRALETVISSGGRVVFAPSIVGKSLRQAELLVRQSGLLMGEQRRSFSNTVKRDFVVSQHPMAGDIVDNNTYINIVVSRGPVKEDKVKRMINLLAHPMAKVEEVLREIGLEITKVRTVINDELREGTVVSQSPLEGTIINKNTAIEITISKLSRNQKIVRDEIIYHEVIQSGIDRQIKIILKDDIGSRVVFEEIKSGGSKIEVPVKILGSAIIEIYADEVLVKKKILE